MRLKASFDTTGYAPPQPQVILAALKTYGMILADNGSDWYLSGAPDARWDDDQLNALKQLRGGELEDGRDGAGHHRLTGPGRLVVAAALAGEGAGVVQWQSVQVRLVHRRVVALVAPAIGRLRGRR